MATTERLYRDDAYLVEFEARVVRRLEHEGRPAVVLDRSAFYPESGGQPWDTGRLGEVAVTAVVDVAGELVHVLEAPLHVDRVTGRVDTARRHDHRQQHHGQHLLSAAFVEVASARTVGFHLGAQESTIDLDREVAPAAVRRAEARTNAVVWEARPVRVRTVTAADARALGVRPPEDAGDDVRLVEAEGFDLQPCGGTHPRSTAEVGVVLVLGAERYKGGSRVHFVCGERALEACAARAAVLEELQGLLSAPLAELASAARGLLDRMHELERRSRDLRERAIEGEALRLLAEAPDPAEIVVGCYEEWPAEDLRLLAQHLTRRRRCLALLGSRGTKGHLVFAQSEGLGRDLGALLAPALARLGGRGGGRGNLVQGGGERASEVARALEEAAASARNGP